MNRRTFLSVIAAGSLSSPVDPTQDHFVPKNQDDLLPNRLLSTTLPVTVYNEDLELKQESFISNCPPINVYTNSMDISRTFVDLYFEDSSATLWIHSPSGLTASESNIEESLTEYIPTSPKDAGFWGENKNQIAVELDKEIIESTSEPYGKGGNLFQLKKSFPIPILEHVEESKVPLLVRAWNRSGARFRQFPRLYGFSQMGSDEVANSYEKFEFSEENAKYEWRCDNTGTGRTKEFDARDVQIPNFTYSNSSPKTICYPEFRYFDHEMFDVFQKFSYLKSQLVLRSIKLLSKQIINASDVSEAAGVAVEETIKILQNIPTSSVASLQFPIEGLQLLQQLDATIESYVNFGKKLNEYDGTSAYLQCHLLKPKFPSLPQLKHLADIESCLLLPLIPFSQSDESLSNNLECYESLLLEQRYSIDSEPGNLGLFDDFLCHDRFSRDWYYEDGGPPDPKSEQGYENVTYKVTDESSRQDLVEQLEDCTTNRDSKDMEVVVRTGELLNLYATLTEAQLRSVEDLRTSIRSNDNKTSVTSSTTRTQTPTPTKGRPTPSSTSTSSPTSTPTSEDGLITRWQFEQGLTDSSNTYDLSPTNSSQKPTYTKQAQEGQYAIDLEDVHLANTDFYSLDRSEPWSICFWMQDSSSNSDWDDDYIVQYNPGGGGWGISTTTDGRPFIYTSGSNTINEDTTAVLDGNWHHVCFVHDQPNEQMSLYVDGNQEYSISYSDSTKGGTSPTIHLGNMSQGYKDYNGRIDDVRFYNRPLLSNEVTRLHGIGKDGKGQQETQEERDTITISGQVIKHDGSPAVKGNIAVYSGDKNDAELQAGMNTDKNGKFTYSLPKGLSHVIQFYQHNEKNPETQEIEPEGVRGPTDGNVDMYAIKRLSGMESRDLGKIRLPKAYKVDARAVREDGSAVEGALFSVRHYNGEASAAIKNLPADSEGYLALPQGDDRGIELQGNVEIMVQESSTLFSSSETHKRDLVVEEPISVDIELQ